MEHPDASDLSVIVTAHREGLLAHATMRSVWAAVRHARRHGIRAAERRCHGFAACGRFLDIGTPQSDASAAQFFARGRAPGPFSLCCRRGRGDPREGR